MIEHLHRLAAHAYYCDEHDAGRRACERLLRLPLSPEKEDRVRANRTWYTRTLNEQGIRCELSRIEIPTRPGWSLFNPSVVSHDGRLIVNVRSSNYRIGDDGRYIIPPEDGERIRTTNHLVWLDGSREPSEWHANYLCTPFPVEGLEDVRLNSVDGKLIASATCRNWHGQDGTCRIAVGEIDRVDRIDNLRCHNSIPGRHEKNWMPITGRREFLYHCHQQGRVCLVREDGDDWTVTAHAESPLVARGFRGGSQLVQMPDGERWLGIVHEVAHDGRRVYEHRVVEFNETLDWKITRVSPPFAFRESRTIEFCAGLAFDAGDLVATFGHMDAEAWMCRFTDWGVWDSWLEDAVWE